jgi:hypothetical protein
VRARALCLRDYARCADACEDALARLGAAAVRGDVAVCAAVCRVAERALADQRAIAEALVQYSVEACHRCVESLHAAGDPSLEAVADAASAAAESATTFLLVR